MLLELTYKCRMGCSHCMVDAKPDDDEMNNKIFNDSLNFVKKYTPTILIIGGGEPIEHPLFFHYMKKIFRLFPNKEQVYVVSNGMFLEDEELTKKVLNLGVKIQVTNDIRYYPKRINMNVKHENIIYETRIRHVSPQGRAVTNGIAPYNTKAPKCFNFKSIAHNNQRTFYGAYKMLEGMFKVCTPMIDTNGNVYIGESRLCNPVGTIYSTDEELYNNVINHKCNKCGMEDKLSDMHLKAIRRVNV